MPNRALRLRTSVGLTLAFVAAVFAGCGGSTSNSTSGTTTPAGAPAETAKPAASTGGGEVSLPPSADESALPEGVRTIVANKFTGDFDQMVTRRLVRIGVTFNRTFYFVERGEQRGVGYELGKAFEEELNTRSKKPTRRSASTSYRCRATFSLQP